MDSKTRVAGSALAQLDPITAAHEAIRRELVAYRSILTAAVDSDFETPVEQFGTIDDLDVGEIYEGASFKPHPSISFAAALTSFEDRWAEARAAFSPMQHIFTVTSPTVAEWKKFTGTSFHDLVHRATRRAVNRAREATYHASAEAAVGIFSGIGTVSESSFLEFAHEARIAFLRKPSLGIADCDALVDHLRNELSFALLASEHLDVQRGRAAAPIVSAVPAESAAPRLPAPAPAPKIGRVERSLIQALDRVKDQADPFLSQEQLAHQSGFKLSTIKNRRSDGTTAIEVIINEGYAERGPRNRGLRRSSKPLP